MNETVKVNAYILAADPAWIEASVLSYYDFVDRIVVSYDADSRGYTGREVDVAGCLRRLRAIDRVGKCDFHPGQFAAPDAAPMACETRQRTEALALAGDGADWVLQLDTDEVLPTPSLLLNCIEDAARVGLRTVDFPSLWLYSAAGGRRFLSWCRRGGRVDVMFPGSMAVRPDVHFEFARRSLEPTYHVDIRRQRHLGGKHVRADRVVRFHESIVHLSMLRSDNELQSKFLTWSHARDRDWSPELDGWRAARKYPRSAALLSQFDLTTRRRHLWPVRLSSDAMRLLQESPEDVANMRTGLEGRGVVDWMRSAHRGWVKPSVDRIAAAVGRRLRGSTGRGSS